MTHEMFLVVPSVRLPNIEKVGYQASQRNHIPAAPSPEAAKAAYQRYYDEEGTVLKIINVPAGVPVVEAAGGFRIQTTHMPFACFEVLNDKSAETPVEQSAPLTTTVIEPKTVKKSKATKPNLEEEATAEPAASAKKSSPIGVSKYGEGEKRAALALIGAGEKTIADIARETGIPASTLRGWIKKQSK